MNEKKHTNTNAWNPYCPVEARCGACQLLDVPYKQQLIDKQARIAKLFAGLVDKKTIMHPIAGMDTPFHYRNKVISPYVPGKIIKGRPVRPPVEKKKNAKRATEKQKPRREILCGMYAAGSHRIIPTDSCLIENEVAKRIILAIRDLMPAHRIEPYREDTNTGFLRHAIVRVGHSSDEVLVTLVTNGKLFPGSRQFVKALVGRCPEVTSVVQNCNTRQTNVILGENETKLYGPGFILDQLCGLSIRISSQSFYQVNALQTEVLYRRAIELAQLSGTETLIDAYCGTGTIGLVAARGVGEEGAHAARVIGVDETEAAIRDARANARHNGIENTEFFAADAGAFMRGLAAGADLRDAAQGFGFSAADDEEPSGDDAVQVDVVLMDPPRSGSSEEFLDALSGLAPRRVVYISCNPDTQVRDIAHLMRQGYHIEAIQPVDMFPHTGHVENIVVCRRNAR